MLLKKLSLETFVKKVPRNIVAKNNCTEMLLKCRQTSTETMCRLKPPYRNAEKLFKKLPLKIFVRNIITKKLPEKLSQKNVVKNNRTKHLLIKLVRQNYP